MVGAAASFHADKARRQVDEEGCHLVAPQLLLQDRFAVLVDAVDLEHILGQVDANSRDLHGGRPSRFRLMTPPLWQVRSTAGGGVHPIAYDTVSHPLVNARVLQTFPEANYYRQFASQTSTVEA